MPCYNTRMVTHTWHFNTKEKPLIYSSLLLLVPLCIAIYLHETNISLLITIVTILSTLHHIFKKSGSEWWWNTRGRHPLQTTLLISDIVSAFVLVCWFVWLLLEKSPSFICVVLIIFIPTFVLYLSTDYKKYVMYHSIWHVVVATLTTIILIY